MPLNKCFLHLAIATLSSFCCISTAQAAEPDNYSDQITEELSIEALFNLPIVAIATGTAVAKEKAPAVTSLITAKDIKALGALTLDEVLESVPGLHVIPSTLSRLNPVYSFRGLYTGFNPQVLFMLNGNRIVGDLYSGGFSFLGRVNVENISRIEVVRGPGSAVYGADAFAGVINIITKSAKEIDGLQAGVRGGSQNTQNAWVQYGGDLGKQWKMAFNVEFFKRDSDQSRTVNSDLQTTFDNLFGSSASLAPGYLDDRFKATSYNIHLNNPNWKIGLDGYLKRNSGVGAGAAQVMDQKGFDDYDQYLFSLAYQNKDWVKDWNFEGKFSYYYAESKPKFGIFPAATVLPVGDDGNIFTPYNGEGCLTANIPGIGCVTTFTDGYLGNPATKNTMPEIQAIALYEGLTDHQMRFNLGFRQEKFKAFESKNFGPGVLDGGTLNGNPNPIFVDGTLTDVTGTPYIFAPNKDRNISYLSLQDVWELNIDWTLTLGLRHDIYSDFGSTTNPRAALVWTPTAKLTTKILYGEAFRAPSFSELYSQNNPIVIGNKNLAPETIKTTELAFNYEVSPDLITDLNIYHYKTKDMIEFVANSDGSKTAQNNKSLIGNGVEIEGRWKINKQWKLLSNYAYQSTKDNQTNQQVAYVPKQQFYLDARYQFMPEWELSSQLNWVGDRKRAIGDLREDIKDYTLVNLTLRRSRFSLGDGGKNWEIAASIKNLLNKKVYEPSDGKIADDYPLNERRLYAEIRYHLPKK